MFTPTITHAFLSGVSWGREVFVCVTFLGVAVILDQVVNIYKSTCWMMKLFYSLIFPLISLFRPLRRFKHFWSYSPFNITLSFCLTRLFFIPTWHPNTISLRWYTFLWDGTIMGLCLEGPPSTKAGHLVKNKLK